MKNPWIFVRCHFSSSVHISHENLVHMRRQAYWTIVVNALTLSFHCTSTVLGLSFFRNFPDPLFRANWALSAYTSLLSRSNLFLVYSLPRLHVAHYSFHLRVPQLEKTRRLLWTFGSNKWRKNLVIEVIATASLPFPLVVLPPPSLTNVTETFWRALLNNFSQAKYLLTVHQLFHFEITICYSPF